MATKEALEKLILELNSKTPFDLPLAKKVLFSKLASPHNVPDVYQIAKQKRALTPVLINCLLSVFARKGSSIKALRLVDDATRDGVAYDPYWNSNIACAQATDGHYVAALRTLTSLHKFKSSVYLPSFPTLIHSLGSAPEGLEFCLGEFNRMLKTHVLVPESVYCALMVKLGESGKFVECMEVFQKMKQNRINGDEKTYSMVIKACLGNKRAHEAYSILLEMIEKKLKPASNIFSSMVDIFGKMGDIQMCEQVMVQMQLSGAKLDSSICNTLLYALANSANMMEQCDEFLLDMERNGISPNTLTYNTMIFGHGNNGNLKRVNVLFEEMKKRQVMVDLITYNAMLNAYAKLGKMEVCEGILAQLVENEFTPNQQTYNLLLDAYYKLGNKEKVDAIFAMMCEKGFASTNEKFNALVRDRVPWHLVEA